MIKNLMDKRNILFISLSIIFFIISIYIIINLYLNDLERVTKAVNEGNSLAKKSANEINLLLTQVSNPLLKLSDKFKDRNYSDEKNISMLKNLANKLNNIVGITLCYDSYKFLPNKKLYCPFYSKRKDQIIRVGKLYDYTDRLKPSNSDWFYNSLEKNRFWSEPYYGPASRSVVAEFGIPITKKGKNIAILDATFSLYDMTKLVKSLSIGQSGYGFLLSENGNLIAHPKFSNLNELININELANENMDKELIQIAKKMKNQEIGYSNYFDPISRQKSWIFYHPIRASKWSIGVMLHKNEISILTKKQIKTYVNLSIYILLSIFFLFLSLTDALMKNNLLSVALSIFLLIGICILFLTYNLNPYRSNIPNNKLITNKADIDNLKNIIRNRIKNLRDEKLYFIQTGIQIHNIKILDAKTIGLNGSIWQKYPNNYFSLFEKGFDFKNISTNAEAYTLELLKTTKTNDNTIFNWKFRVDIFNEFKYNLFPFDKKNIYIEIIPKELGKNIFLVPFLESYNFVNFSSTPGVDKNVPLIGWEIEGSFFSINFEDIKTNFGQEGFKYS